MELVAEFTTNHLGNTNLLHRMVSAAKLSGADSIKMQRKDIDHFYSREKLSEPYESPYGKTYGDYRRSFELRENDWFSFSNYCDHHAIPWFSTAQDLPSLSSIGQSDPWRIKIASVNARNQSLLQAAKETVSRKVEVVLSLGGCTLLEAETALSYFRDHKHVYLLHCVAEYPTKPGNLRLGNIPALASRFASENVSIGYSGHELGIDASIAAYQLGAKMIERHFCLSRASFTHHIECSLEPSEFLDLRHRLDRNAETVDLPSEAYKEMFGMSEREDVFLRQGIYHTHCGIVK